MTVLTSVVLQTPAARRDAAVAHFAGRLSFEADVSDVAADIGAGAIGWVLIDSRSQESWDQGHVPGAIHLPTREIAARAASVVPEGVTVVTYCWGPGCNGATKAALEFARLGYPVKEMIGGFEYWTREGLPVQTAGGIERRATDPLTAPLGIACAC
ncbi:rhodanese-like domain-containing protein [Kribbella capetownensis]|uniref:Rhodanese-like domain-containing protein n=1 Tax=Kribbella capetownensis TaxID=1572659 RepID=A0A4R0KAF3_9ACTN|nr:rhodanese-like domain-containing protein [Kribbella capetownensis]TCC52255.1 rhodanese-like domain-containing protein [Kribbella capetownensis]